MFFKILFKPFQTELEEAVHRLELEKTKLEAALDHEQEKTHMLQRDLGESQKVCIPPTPKNYQKVIVIIKNIRMFWVLVYSWTHTTRTAK